MKSALIHLATRLPMPGTTGLPDHERVFVPALDRFPPALHDIMSLLPVTDINGALLTALRHCGSSMPTGLIAGLFAADPFLDLLELADHLRAAGITRVANCPTLQHFDGATAEGLAAVGYHVAAEFAVLSRLAAEGFDVVAYVATLKAAEAAIAAGFATLAYHPGPPPAPASERAALGLIRTLAANAGVRLLMHASSTETATTDTQPIKP